MSVLDERESVLELQRVVYHYRMAGETIDAIAEKLSLTVNQVVKYHRAYMVHLARAQEAEGVEHGKMLELDRLDTLMRAHWPYATESHEQDVVVGTGRNQHVERIVMPPDLAAAKMVLDVIKQRAKLKGWEVADPVDNATVQNILIVGTNQKAYLEAMLAGRAEALDSAHPDNVLEGEVEEGSS